MCSLGRKHTTDSTRGETRGMAAAGTGAWSTTGACGSDTVRRGMRWSNSNSANRTFRAEKGRAGPRFCSLAPGYGVRTPTDARGEPILRGALKRAPFGGGMFFFCPWSKNGAIGSNVGWLQWRPPVTRRQCTGALRALRPGESALGLGDSLFALRTRPGSAYVLPSRELLHSCI